MYRRTQPGTLLVAVLLVSMGVFGTVLFAVGLTLVMAIVEIVLLIILLIFRSLTIEIDQEELRCFFGGGLIKRRFPIAEILSAKPVKNRWYYGWGIRLIPSGWMFNVSGLEAVERLGDIGLHAWHRDLQMTGNVHILGSPSCAGPLQSQKIAQDMECIRAYEDTSKAEYSCICQGSDHARGAVGNQGEVGRTEESRQPNDLSDVHLSVRSPDLVVFEDPIQGRGSPSDGELPLGTAGIGILEVDVFDALDLLGCEGPREIRPIPLGLLSEKEGE